MRADGSRQHLIPTGLQGIVDIAWGTAPPAPAGHARLPAQRAVPVAAVPTAPATRLYGDLPGHARYRFGLHRSVGRAPR